MKNAHVLSAMVVYFILTWWAVPGARTAAAPEKDGAEAERRPAKASIAVSVVDLHPELKQQQLREGINTVYKLKGGDCLMVHVKRGSIMDYTAKDSKGKKVPIIITKIPLKDPVLDEIERLLAEQNRGLDEWRDRKALARAIEEALERSETDEKGCLIFMFGPMSEDGTPNVTILYTDCPKGAP